MDSQFIISPSLLWVVLLLGVLDHYTQLGFLGPCFASMLTFALTLEAFSMCGHTLVGCRLYKPAALILLLSRRVRGLMLFLPGPLGRYFGSLYFADSNQLQYALTESQRYIPALHVNHDSVNRMDRLYGTRSPQRAEELINRAYILGMMGNHSQSESVSGEALTILRGAPQKPSNTISLCFALNNLGVALVDQRKVPQSLELFEQALQIKREKMPKSKVNLATAYSNVGYALLCGGQHAEAEKYGRQALSMLGTMSRQAPELHAIILNNLGEALRCQGKLDEAEEMLLSSLMIRERVLSRSHPHRAYSYHNFAMLLFDRNENERSREYFEKALAIRKSFPGESRELNSTIVEYAKVLRRLGREAEADALLEVHQISRDSICATSAESAQAAETLQITKFSQDQQLDPSIAESAALPAWLQGTGSHTSSSQTDASLSSSEDDKESWYKDFDQN